MSGIELVSHFNPPYSSPAIPTYNNNISKQIVALNLEF